MVLMPVPVATQWQRSPQWFAGEEMLYLALVSNLMTAIGAAPVLAGPTSVACCPLVITRCGSFTRLTLPLHVPCARSRCAWHGGVAHRAPAGGDA